MFFERKKGKKMMSSNQSVISVIFEQVLGSAETFFGRKISPKISLKIKPLDGSPFEKYPTSWQVHENAFTLAVWENFNLVSSWWNFEPENKEWESFLQSFSFEESLYLVLCHEIAHIFLYPTPLRPWFQEMAATKLGLELYVFIREKEFQMNFLLDKNYEMKYLLSVENYQYLMDFENVKLFQKKALLACEKMECEKFIFIRNIYEQKQYRPFEEKRSFFEIDQELGKMF